MVSHKKGGFQKKADTFPIRKRRPANHKRVLRPRRSANPHGGWASGKRAHSSNNGTFPRPRHNPQNGRGKSGRVWQWVRRGIPSSCRSARPGNPETRGPMIGGFAANPRSPSADEPARSTPHQTALSPPHHGWLFPSPRRWESTGFLPAGSPSATTLPGGAAARPPPVFDGRNAGP